LSSFAASGGPAFALLLFLHFALSLFLNFALFSLFGCHPSPQAEDLLLSLLLFLQLLFWLSSQKSLP
jgi:hypothetical protein